MADNKRRQELPDDSPMKYLPGTIFFIMMNVGFVGLMMFKTVPFLVIGGVGALLIWLFYW